MKISIEKMVNDILDGLETDFGIIMERRTL